MKSGWKIDILRKYIYKKNKRFSGLEKIDVFSVTSVEGFVRSTDYFKKEVFSKDLSNYKVVEKNQFAFNPSRINIGSIAFLANEEPVLVSPLYTIFEVNKEYLSPEYLLRYLKSNYGYTQIKKNSEGAVRESLKYEGLEKILIPLPPLDQQLRINSILNRVEILISQRRKSLKMLNDLKKSLFIDMFKINDSGYKKWSIEPLNLNVDILAGVTKGKKYNSSELLEVPYMRVANVQDGYFDISEMKNILVPIQDLEKYRIIKGDLLLTEGGDPDKLGRGAIWNDEIKNCIHQNHVFRVRIKETSINPIFLIELISSKYGKNYFLKAAKQTTGIASINSIQLKAFPLFKPPIDLQNKFAEFVEIINQLYKKSEENLDLLENLYVSLRNQAYKGELNLSKVSIYNEVEVETVPSVSKDIIKPLKSTREFTKNDLIKIVNKFSEDVFSFEELWKEVESSLDTKSGSKEEIQNIFWDLLEKDGSGLYQVFDKLSSQRNEQNVEKRIAFRANYEN